MPPGAGAPPAGKFQEFNEQWLEQTEDMAADFVNTPSMEHLKAGTFGAFVCGAWSTADWQIIVLWLLCTVAVLLNPSLATERVIRY